MLLNGVFYNTAYNNSNSTEYNNQPQPFYGEYIQQPVLYNTPG